MRKKDLDEELAKLRMDADACDDLSEMLSLCRQSCNLAERALDQSDAQQLARAICDFADWQKTGYKWEPKTRAEIGSRLWSEVSALVDSANQERPENPCFNAET